MKLSKNKVAGGVLGLLAIVSIVNTQAIVSLTNYVRGDSSNGMSLDGSNQSAQVVNFSTKTTENAVYKRGDKSDVILQVQKALTSKGLYKGDISGLMGPKTEKAISDFQKSNGLTVTGTLDQNTISAVLRGGGSGTNTGPGMSALPACNRNSEPWIRVLSPNGGEVYQAGEEINVTWRKCNVPAGVDVGITLLNEVSGQPLPTFVNHVQIEQTPNDGSQIISASAMQGLSPFEYGNRFKVRLNYVVTNSYDWQTYGNNPAWMQNGDESNNLFTIIDGEGCAEGTIIGYDSTGNPIFCQGDGDGCAPGVIEPSIELTSPFMTGGYHGAFAPGQQLTVTWNTCNISNNAKVSIGLIQEDALNVQPQFIEFLTNKFGTINDGTETFTLPGMTNGTEKARIVISVTTPSYNIFAGNPLNVQDSILSDFSLGYAEFD